MDVWKCCCFRYQDIQAFLPLDYRLASILCNRLLNAVADVKQSQLTYHGPDNIVHVVIFDPYSPHSTVNSLELGVTVKSKP